LLAAGWRVRYEPAVRVAHHEPTSPVRLLRRRFDYGTSAAPLARRHPGQLSHLTLAPAPALTVGLLLARRPLAAAGAFGMGTGLLARRLRRAGVGWTEAAGPSAAGVGATWLGIGRWSTQFALPALALLLARPGPGSPRTRLGRRAAVATLVLGPSLAEWRRRRPRPPPARFCLAYLLDQAAYGAGVYAGCHRHRLWAPVRPSVTIRRPGSRSRI
ncbi:MAG TPA: hypothetical protein VHW47_07350, partial [Acidimicrobiales bacterium]|nr:hypothetical protein [Acidimicrobiales bacterium]